MKNKYKLPNDAFNRQNEQKISEQDIILKLRGDIYKDKNKKCLKEEQFKCE